MSEAQSCGLHLSFGSARNASPLPWSTSCFSIFRFTSIFPRPFYTRFRKLPLSQHALTHVESIFEFGGHAASHGRWLDITRILEHLRTFLEFDPRIPEVAPKIPRLPPIPFLSARTPCTYELPRLGFERYDRLTIKNLTRNSM